MATPVSLLIAQHQSRHSERLTESTADTVLCRKLKIAIRSLWLLCRHTKHKTVLLTFLSCNAQHQAEPGCFPRQQQGVRDDALAVLKTQNVSVSKQPFANHGTA